MILSEISTLRHAKYANRLEACIIERKYAVLLKISEQDFSE
jgi:hypothetical protein